MAAALHIPPSQAPCDEIRRLVRQWAERVDWMRVRHVVWVGDPGTEPWTIFREYRPDVRTVVYHVGGQCRAVDESTTVTTQPVELHAAVASSFHSRDRLEIAGEPNKRALVDNVRAIVDGAVDYALAQEITIRQRSVQWVELGLRLLPHIVERPLVQNLPAAWAGRPAVIVGGGPSLDEDLDALRAVGDRAIVIAASSAAGALAAGGITPHAWVCAETKPEASLDLRRLGTHRGAYLIPGTHCHEEFWTLESKGTIPLAQVSIGLGSMLARRCGVQLLGSGSSVTTLCYSVARTLGANPVILVGQDCGFRDESVPYAMGRDDDLVAGAIAGVDVHRAAGLLYPVTAWGGIGHVTTTPTLTIFRQFFEVKACSPSEPTIINASRRGARIAHTVESLLEDIDMPVPPTSPVDALDLAVAAATRLERDTLREALAAEIDSLAPYAESAARARDAAAELVSAMDDVKRLGLKAGLCAAYAVPPVDEVQYVLPRQGVTSMQSVAGRIAEYAPRLEGHLRDALARLEDQR